VTLTYGLSIILYLFYPNYIDHYEATVSAIAWQATHSHPIYPDWQTGDIYAAPYGPLLFVTIGTVLQSYPRFWDRSSQGRQPSWLHWRRPTSVSISEL